MLNGLYEKNKLLASREASIMFLFYFLNFTAERLHDMTHER